MYVVERYLPGISDEDLRLLIGRLGGVARELQAEGTDVTYLGSTIVPGDESCFCQFEAPSEEAVAEANRRAGVPYDRIVSGLAVMPERTEEGE